MISLGQIDIPCIVERPAHIKRVRMLHSVSTINVQNWNFLRSMENMRDLYTLLNSVRGAKESSAPYYFTETCRLVKPVMSAHLSLLIELYRDYMLGLGYMYPPYHKYDNRNRSCFDVQMEVLPTYYNGAAEVEFLEKARDHPTFTFTELQPLLTETNSGASRRRIVILRLHVSLRPSAFYYTGMANLCTPRVVCCVILKFLPCFTAVQSTMQAWERHSNPSGRLNNIQTIMEALETTRAVEKENASVYGLHLPLKGHQVENVDWMEMRERVNLDKVLWCPIKDNIYYSPVLNFWRRGHVTSYGGFLADEMGMGKTLTMLAVISRNRLATTYKNLIIVPTSLLGQWKNEIVSKTNLSVVVFHGPRRQKEPTYLSQFDIVLTSYGIVREDYELMEAYQWHRIVLDEGHTIKNMNSAISRRCRNLNAKVKWLLSGTPMVTQVSDLCSQLGFLGLLTHRGFFRTMLNLGAYQSERDTNIHADRLTYLMKQILRKRKQSCIQLPPIQHRTVFLELDESSRQKYTNMYAEALHNRQTLTKLVKLREFCSNGNQTNAADEVRFVVDETFDASADSCCICLDAMDCPVRTKCKHHFCQECLLHYIQVRRGSSAPCPLCRAVVKPNTIRRVYTEAPEESTPVSPGGIFAKLSRIVDDVSTIIQEENRKCIIFTNYKHTMLFYKKILHEKRIPFNYITGNMTQGRRFKEIHSFQQSQTYNVFLLSVRAGAVGIDLTSATDIVFTEPCLYNIQQQAVARAHRLGQKNTVKVTHYIMQDTIEEKMHALGSQFVSTNRQVMSELLS